MLSRQTFETPGTVTNQAPLSMVFFRKVITGVLSCPTPGSSLTGDHVSCCSCIGKQILSTEPPGKPTLIYLFINHQDVSSIQISYHERKCLKSLNYSWLLCLKLKNSSFKGGVSRETSSPMSKCLWVILHVAIFLRLFSQVINLIT